MINWENIKKSKDSFCGAKPFDHTVIDNFLDEDVAFRLSSEFPDFNSEIWHTYQNAIEVKKSCNNWNSFPECTYELMSELCSYRFSQKLSDIILGRKEIHPDPGLHGGGWHIHKSGGKLNTHLDYSIHPKLKLRRKLNLIIYLNPNWQESWGGALGFWESSTPEKPGALIKSISCSFNRAVIFDTTQNSWHGLPQPITCPANETRRSLAVYYLCQPDSKTPLRDRALFAPTEEQRNDPEIQKLIKLRSSSKTSSQTYRNE